MSNYSKVIFQYIKINKTYYAKSNVILMFLPLIKTTVTYDNMTITYDNMTGFLSGSLGSVFCIED